MWADVQRDGRPDDRPPFFPSFSSHILCWQRLWQPYSTALV